MFMTTKMIEGTLIIINKKTKRYCFLVEMLDFSDDITLDEHDEIIKRLEYYGVDFRIDDLEPEYLSENHDYYFLEA